MPNPSSSPTAALATRYDLEAQQAELASDVRKYLERLLARLLAWAKLAKERPHDFMAFAVISSIGAYFSFVGYMLVLSGPGE
jgi:hypothetical protein